ncbi:unnamed protein product [Dicrocoelium dendriticum]|nr:unnamed protein product [Dicrocoelium dendriticum]
MQLTSSPEQLEVSFGINRSGEESASRRSTVDDPPGTAEEALPHSTAAQLEMDLYQTSLVLPPIPSPLICKEDNKITGGETVDGSDGAGKAATNHACGPAGPDHLQYDATETLEVQLNRPREKGLGLTVVGYVYKRHSQDTHYQYGIFIRAITPGSVADKSAQLQVQDQIVKVNDKALLGLDNVNAVAALKEAENPIVLSVLRHRKGFLHEQLMQADSRHLSLSLFRAHNNAREQERKAVYEYSKTDRNTTLVDLCTQGEQLIQRDDPKNRSFSLDAIKSPLILELIEDLDFGNSFTTHSSTLETPLLLPEDEKLLELGQNEKTRGSNCSELSAQYSSLEKLVTCQRQHNDTTNNQDGFWLSAKHSNMPNGLWSTERNGSTSCSKNSARKFSPTGMTATRNLPIDYSLFYASGVHLWYPSIRFDVSAP